MSQFFLVLYGKYNCLETLELLSCDCPRGFDIVLILRSNYLIFFISHISYISLSKFLIFFAYM